MKIQEKSEEKKSPAGPSTTIVGPPRAPYKLKDSHIEFNVRLGKVMLTRLGGRALRLIRLGGREQRLGRLEGRKMEIFHSPFKQFSLCFDLFL